MRGKKVKHNKPHKMGRKGYYGKTKEWQEKDEKLATEGKENPWEQFPGRSRHICGQGQGRPPVEAET